LRRFLRDGALAGLAGGAALSLVLLLVGEDSINRAIALERGGAGDGHEEMFSRGVQQAGGVLASMIWGLALGLVFAIVFVAFRRRWATGSDWRASAAMAATAFVTLVLVPFLKYPPNPPGVGDSDSIGRRTGLWLLMVAWSVAASAAAWMAGRRLDARSMPEHLRVPAVIGLYVALVAVGLAVLPGSDDSIEVPATLVWRFRLASLSGTAAYWAVVGVVFGWLRVAAGSRPRSSTRYAAT
jgi:predicted cobalt transporter CbtA